MDESTAVTRRDGNQTEFRVGRLQSEMKKVFIGQFIPFAPFWSCLGR